MKVVIIGGVAAGATFATNFRRLNEEAEIIIFEKDRDVSYRNCEIPYYLSGMIDDSSKLVARNPEIFKKKDNIIAKNYAEVLDINRKKKYIRVCDKRNDKIFNESYDKLVIATGMTPNIPDIKGSQNDNVFVVKNVVDVENIKSYIDKNNSKTVSIVGGGFIALEAAENLKEYGLEVNLLVRSKVLSANLDDELIGFVEDDIKDSGVNLIKSRTLKEIHKDYLILDDDSKLDSDLLILAMGMKPLNKLAKDAGLEISEENGLIITDDNFKSSDDNIFAIGDVVEVTNQISGKKMKLSLAYPAHKAAKLLANHLAGKKTKPISFIATFALRSFNLNIAVTGLKESTLKDLGYKYETAIISHIDKVSIMPDSKMMYMKILFDKEDGKIYGAQALGPGDVNKRIDVIAGLIYKNSTIYDLEDIELAYQPLYSTTYDAINVLASKAIQVKNGSYKQVKLKDLKDIMDEYKIYDIRKEDLYKKSHLKTAINLPADKIRENVDTLDKNEKILLYDQTGGQVTSISKYLNNLSYDNIYILEGSFVFLEHYDTLKNLNLLEK